MKTILINLFALDELEAKARERALREYAYFNVEDYWWRDIYEDAKMIKLKLTGLGSLLQWRMDSRRPDYCQADFRKSRGEHRHISNGKSLCRAKGK